MIRADLTEAHERAAGGRDVPALREEAGIKPFIGYRTRAAPTRSQKAPNGPSRA
jgi:hypothetical protein